jgi:hypothetical protein
MRSQGIAPCREPGFTTMYFLTAANQGDDDRPALVATHDV